MTGAVVGGLAGVAAGYALSKALEGHDHPASVNANTSRQADPMEDMGLVRMDSPSSDDLGRFDAGTGQDWDSDNDQEDW